MDSRICMFISCCWLHTVCTILQKLRDENQDKRILLHGAEYAERFRGIVRSRDEDEEDVDNQGKMKRNWPYVE